MPIVASSAHGLPAQLTEPGVEPTPADDGARPSTAAVCRHLLGDALDPPPGGYPGVLFGESTAS